MHGDHRERRQVVTGFVWDARAEKLLLLKRSARVHTYPHHWASVRCGAPLENVSHDYSRGSGSMEPGDCSPRDRMLREVEEELGLLQPNSTHAIVLRRAGKPLRVDDHEKKLYWLVHPFWLELPAATGASTADPPIRIDWEHEEYRWISLMEFHAWQPQVPNLLEALERVWLPAALEAQLQQLQSDLFSGANALAQRAMQAFSLGLREDTLQMRMSGTWNARGTVQNRFQQLWLPWAWHLCHCRPSMSAPITSHLCKVLKRMEERISHRSLTVGEAEQLVREQQECSELELRQVVQHTCEYLWNQLHSVPHATTLVLVTISKSGTVSETLLALMQQFGAVKQQQQLHIIVCESRPGMEGTRMLLHNLVPNLDKMTHRNRVRLTLITEAQMGWVFRQNARDPDQLCFAIVGADSIHPSWFSNKIGTLPLAVISKTFGIPLLLVSETSKLSVDEHAKEVEEEQDWRGLFASEAELTDWTEAMQKHGDQISIRNQYFDKVDFHLLHPDSLWIHERGSVEFNKVIENWKEHKKLWTVFDSMQ